MSRPRERDARQNARLTALELAIEFFKDNSFATSKVVVEVAQQFDAYVLGTEAEGRGDSLASTGPETVILYGDGEEA